MATNKVQTGIRFDPELLYKITYVAKDNKRSLNAQLEYLAQTCKNLYESFDFEALKNADTPTARKILLGLKGVGPKVADCILLFGLHRGDVFPVDTWIKKAYHDGFETGLKDDKISAFFVEKFKNLQRLQRSMRMPVQIVFQFLRSRNGFLEKMNI